MLSYVNYGNRGGHVRSVKRVADLIELPVNACDRKDVHLCAEYRPILKLEFTPAFRRFVIGTSTPTPGFPSGKTTGTLILTISAPTFLAARGVLKIEPPLFLFDLLI